MAESKHYSREKLLQLKGVSHPKDALMRFYGVGFLDGVKFTDVVQKEKISKQQSREDDFKTVVNKIIKKLCEEHKSISVSTEMLGGMPHISGVRLSVGNVLAKLHYYGNIDKVLEIYGEDVSEQQIKEAIAYAQDFLENVCVTSKSY